MAGGVGQVGGPQIPIVGDGPGEAQGQGGVQDQGAALQQIADGPGALGVGQAGAQPMDIGDAAGGPNPGGGEVRTRGERVRDFFAGVRDTVVDAFHTVKDTLAEAVSKIGSFFHGLTAAGRAEARHDAAQTEQLSSILEAAANDLENQYQAHLGGLQPDEGVPTRQDFLNDTFDMPTRQYVASDSALHFGDRLAAAADGIGPRDTPERQEMQNELNALLGERPVLDVLLDNNMERQVSNLNPGNVDAFLRGNSVYTKASKYVMAETVDKAPFMQQMRDGFETRLDAAKTDFATAALFAEDAEPPRLSELTDAQAGIVMDMAENIFNTITDDAPDGAYLQLMSDEVKDVARDMLDALDQSGQAGATIDAAKTKVIANNFFLREIVADLRNDVNSMEDTDRAFAALAMNMVLRAVNGIGNAGAAASPAANAAYQDVFANPNPQMEAFEAAVVA